MVGVAGLDRELATIQVVPGVQQCEPVNCAEVQAGLDSGDWEVRQAALRALRALLPAARDYRDRVAILLHTVTQSLTSYCCGAVRLNCCSWLKVSGVWSQACSAAWTTADLR